MNFPRVLKSVHPKHVRRRSALRLLLVLLLALPLAVRAQFTYLVTNGTVTITGYTGYTGPGVAVTIPDNIDDMPVTGIAGGAFDLCLSLTTVQIPAGVASIADGAFEACWSLTNIYFEGNAPSLGAGVFFWGAPATVYYAPGRTGFGATFGELPTALWNPQLQYRGSGFGVGTNGFSFLITWARGISVAVDACTNLASPTWSPVQTNILTEGAFYFSEPGWTLYGARFYRLRWAGWPSPAGTFHNLGFETPTFVPVSTMYPGSVDPAEALPGWTVWWGTDLAPFVLHDSMFLDSAGVSILDTNCAAYANGWQCLTKTFQGNFTLLLQGGFSLSAYPQAQSVAIAQTALIPASAQTMLFDASLMYAGFSNLAFTVSLAGQDLGFSAVATYTNYVRYAVDVSRFSGQAAEIRFTAHPYIDYMHAPINNVYLDDIHFSNTPMRAQFR